ncbi:S8 family serine peptidase [Williamsia sp. CHRR-6]|nr:S8 family serine peptidase [Williamsia sp. CHRR-6]
MFGDNGFNSAASAGSTTGRRVVVFARSTDAADYAAALRQVAGLTEVASTLDFSGRALDLDQVGSAQATIFAQLGVAVVDADPDQVASLEGMCAADGAIRTVEHERIHHIRAGGRGSDYIAGFRDGVDALSAQLLDTSASVAAAPSFVDTDAATWGLQATGVVSSSATGAGVTVAVLDTGFDLSHPDFTGRDITDRSFVAGQTVADGVGHGTHCIGTSCGPLAPGTGRRYGVAHEATILVGKVLDNSGSGSDQQILAGLDWALSNSAHVVSMSLGADVREVSAAYETVGRRALNRGTLIVAAAGNNARRPADPGFVGVPANSPSIAAVAAVDSSLAIAPFSARSLGIEGGNIDVAGPGVDVYSSWPVQDIDGASRYNTISGTSMATPHVAGIAALWAQVTGRRGRDLWTTLTQQSSRLQLPASDVGSGLVQAPQ